MRRVLISGWTWEKEKAFLEMLNKKPLGEVAKEFGIKYHQAYSYCQCRGIKPVVKKYRKWSGEEVKLMETTQPLKLAQELGVKPHIVHQRKRAALKKGLIENRWRDNQELPTISDEQLEFVEDNFCRKCKHENADKSCRILTRAYNNVFPQNWNLDKDPVCNKFEKREGK